MRFRAASLLSLAALGCSGRQPPVTVPPPLTGPTCHVLLQTGPARDSIVVGVTDEIDTAHVRHPITDAERIVFALFAPAVTQKDCNGRALPDHDAAYQPSVLTPQRVVASPITGRGVTIVYRVAADARDLLDRGADVVFTDDPAALDYAARRDAYQTAPLPWAWTYVLAGQPPVQDNDVLALSELLAASGVHGDVRAADSLPRWGGLRPCDDAPFNTARPMARRIAYSTSDAVARDLATRLVALSGEGRAFSDAVSALPLSSRAFDSALVARTELGYVTTVPYRTSCAPFASLGVTPLVDARAHVIVRKGVIGIDVDADGTPRLVLGQ